MFEFLFLIHTVVLKINERLTESFQLHFYGMPFMDDDILNILEFNFNITLWCQLELKVARAKSGTT